MVRTAVTMISIVFVGACAVVMSAELAEVRAKLSGAGCTFFRFTSTVESRIFDTVDTAYGTAYIAADGPYRIEIGPDVYLYDGKFLYSYFWENNQVIIELADTASLVADEISFVMKLDEWYDSHALDKNGLKLLKKEKIEGDIPDSMIVFINAADSTISQIEYYDINEDLNRIFFDEQFPDSTCNGKRFEPDFPDSVERVRL